MIYEMRTACKDWNAGDTVTTEELAAAGCDIPFLLERKAIQPVGFLAPGDARTDEQQAQIVADLHVRIEELETEGDKLREENRAQRKRIGVLEEGHKVGTDQLAAAKREAEQAKAALAKHLAEKGADNGGAVGRSGGPGTGR